MTDDKSNSPLNSGANAEPNSAPHSETQRAAPPTTPIPAVSAPSSPACDRIRPELKAYLDGQTGWWRHRAIRAHVAHCAACREEREAMRDFSDNLRSADAETLDPALRAKILAAVPHTAPALAEVRPSRRRRQRPLLLAGAAASAALVGAVLYPALTSHSVPDTLSARYASSMHQEMESTKRAQTVAAGTPPHAMNAAPTITNGVPGESAGGAFPASAKAAKPSFARSIPAAPAPGASSESANSVADKPMNASVASAPMPGPPPVGSMRGNMSDKSSAKGAQDVADADISPAAPASITVEVRDVETRSADVEQKALAAGGKIVQSGLATDTDKTLSATLTLKIPAARLEGFLTQVAGLGQLQSRQPTPESPPAEDAARVEAYAPKAAVKSKARRSKEVATRRPQATLVPVTVNLKSDG